VHPQLTFEIEDPLIRRQATTLYIQEMAKRGCHGYASFYLNAAQGDAELEQTTAAARETFARITAALDRGEVDRLLTCQPQEESFRRLVL
jgi:glutamate-1-semialdehyde 2,1-aminomutase